jgi:hypothetical protein
LVLFLTAARVHCPEIKRDRCSHVIVKPLEVFGPCALLGAEDESSACGAQHLVLYITWHQDLEITEESPAL